MKKLIIMRHADAQPEHLYPIDSERTLSKNGWIQLESLRSLAKQELAYVDAILCSNAKRARQTLDALESMIPSNADRFFESNLYQANSNSLMRAIESVDAKKKCVLLICHNPGITHLLFALASGAHIAPPNLPKAFPTAAMAIFEGEINSWGMLSTKNLQFQKIILP